jgi:hypothetical protein
MGLLPDDMVGRAGILLGTEREARLRHLGRRKGIGSVHQAVIRCPSTKKHRGEVAAVIAIAAGWEGSQVLVVELVHPAFPGCAEIRYDLWT